MKEDKEIDEESIHHQNTLSSNNPAKESIYADEIRGEAEFLEFIDRCLEQHIFGISNKSDTLRNVNLSPKI